MVYCESVTHTLSTKRWINTLLKIVPDKCTIFSCLFGEKGFNGYFWSRSKNRRSMDQRRDPRPPAAAGIRTNTQPSAAGRFVSLLVSAFRLCLALFLSERTVCRLSGLVHYDDLNQPVTKADADVISEIVERAVVSVLPGAQMTLIGGFRR